MKSRCWQNDARRASEKKRDAAVAASRSVFPPPQRVSPADMRFRVGQRQFGRNSFARCGIRAILQLQAFWRLQAARSHRGALNSMRYLVSKLPSPLRSTTTRGPGLRRLTAEEPLVTRECDACRACSFDGGERRRERLNSTRQLAHSSVYIHGYVLFIENTLSSNELQHIFVGNNLKTTSKC